MHIDLVFRIIHNTLWGVLFGLFFAMVYDYVPATGIKKGLVYGLIIWIIAILRIGILSTIHGSLNYAIPHTLAGFFSICIVYGSLIGILYKKE
jgi:hypothetical protein